MEAIIPATCGAVNGQPVLGIRSPTSNCLVLGSMIFSASASIPTDPVKSRRYLLYKMMNAGGSRYP